MGERVLILGVTGTDKKQAVRNLQDYMTKQGQQKFDFFDFEKDFILNANTDYREIQDYLNQDPTTQRQSWLRGWDLLAPSLAEYRSDENKHIVLSIHGVLVGLVTGISTPINIPSLIDFDPTVIITLIDDVYTTWCKTEERSHGISFFGKPTVAQLVDARRSEIIIGDIVKNHVNPKTKHYALATKHPVRSLYRLIFQPKNRLRTVYLSFPITEPRKQLKAGSHEGIEQVNKFIEQASQVELENPNVVFFCPLSIDELPLLAESEVAEGQCFFDLAHRWDVTSYYGDIPLIDSRSPGRDERRICIPYEQVDGAAPLINADVASRDYRLVRQADYLAVFDPHFGGRISSGVHNEVTMATGLKHLCHIYQDPKYDPENEAKKIWSPPGTGALGPNLITKFVHFHETLDSLFEALRSL